jgi:hypothetical protein
MNNELEEVEHTLENKVGYLLRKWDNHVKQAMDKTQSIEEALELSATLLACIRVMIGEQQKQIDQLNKK